MRDPIRLARMVNEMVGDEANYLTLIHHPLEADGASHPYFDRVLAHHLLHHPDKRDGVGLSWHRFVSLFIHYPCLPRWGRGTEASEKRDVEPGDSGRARKGAVLPRTEPFAALSSHPKHTTP